MNIDYLRELLVLADTLSFTDAAKACFISQSTLSKHVSSVEDELGIKLFMRGKNGLTVSNPGKTFIESAREIVSIYDSALSHVSKTKYELANSISVGYLAGIFVKHIDNITKQFLKENTEASLNYIEYISIKELEDAIKCGDVDTAVLTLPVDSEFLKTDKYIWTPFMPDAICAALWADHPLAGKIMVSMKDLAHESIAVVQDSSLTQWENDKILGSVPPESINTRLKFDSFSGMSSLIKAKQCVSVSFLHLRDFFDDGSLSFVPIAEFADVKYQTGLLWAKKNDSIAVRRFAKCCHDEFRG